MRIEFYFDFSCPFAYLGSEAIEALARRTGAELVWRPFLLGGVLRALGSDETLAGEPEAKRRHSAADAQRWAELRGVPLRESPHHPQRTVRALRTLLAVDQARWPPLIHALYRAYWQRGESITDEAVLGRALAEAGVDGPAAGSALAADRDPAIKEALRERTDEALARGVFGAPTLFVDGPGGRHMFWGQDRLEMAEAVLRGWDPDRGQPPAPGTRAPEPPPPLIAAGAAIDFWFDFSSPFSYLGATQIEQVAARAGARLTWRPMLLGAVFRDVGTPNIPLFAASESKRRYTARELAYWSSWWGVPFRFTSHFPQKTVTAGRLALLAGDRIAEVSRAFFRALWVEDRPLEDDAVLVEELGRLGLDGAGMLARTRDPDAKQLLIDSTAAAVRAGVFGAPSCVVTQGERARLFWGQDRLAMVERAARGLPPIGA